LQIHLVYDEDYIEQLRDILESAGHDIVEWDYSLSQFADFSERKQQITAEVAVVDGQAGVTEKKEIIEALTIVRRNIPALRLILVLPASLEKDDNFISKLLTLSIYDMYFKDEYSIDDLDYWLSHPKSFANYNINNSNITGGIGDKTKVKIQDEKPPEDSSLLIGILNKTLQIATDKLAGNKDDKPKKKEQAENNNPFLGMINRTFQAATRTITSIQEKNKAATIEDAEIADVADIDTGKNVNPALSPVEKDPPAHQPLEPQKSNPTQPVPKKIYGFNNVYGYKVPGYDDVVNFDDWESLTRAAALVAPDIILFASMPGIKEKIESVECITAVIGEATDETLNADYHFGSWSEQAKVKAYSSKEQIDPLTELPGRYTLGKESNILIQKGNVFSLAVCDLDFFKTVNDTYGHQAGDAVLKEFAGFLRQNVRKSDIVIRYGGEEFVLLYPDSEKQQIISAMQKIRQAWKDCNTYKITFSAGLASYPKDGQTLEELFSYADKALYKAKNSGRDMICLGNEPTRIIRLTRPAKTELQVWAVCGTAPRVGTTSFAAALYETVRRGNSAILIDAGGGASRYKQAYKAPPYAFPGSISIVDAGTKISDELSSLTTYFFIVTDLCGNFDIRKHLRMPELTCLVGNRGAIPGKVRAVANSWNTKYICLGNEPRLTEKYDQIYLPKRWRQAIKQITRKVVKR